MPKTCPHCHAVCYSEFAIFCVCGHKFGSELEELFGKGLADIFKKKETDEERK
jgi:hypothetical protein